MGIALTHTLETPRLQIEPVTPALAAAARAGPAAFADVVGAETPADWHEASLRLVARSAAHAWGPTPAPIRAIAIHRHERSIVGDVRFEPSLRAARQFEIGYGVARSRRRQGYAVEMTGAIIDWLFETGAADTLIAGCDKRNVASVRTLRRLGFWLDTTPGQAFWWIMTPDQRAEYRSATRA
jgi:RimJ/RimL family protein N-acetyltransferase